MIHSWSIIIGLVVVVLASVAGWFLSPKGETQTYVPSTCDYGLPFVVIADIIEDRANYLLQDLAKLLDPLLRQLLPNVGCVQQLHLTTCFTNFVAAITFLAQWHPLITPRRGDLTEHSVHEN